MPIIEIQRNFENIGIQSRKQTIGLELDMVNNFIKYRKTLFDEKSDKQMAIFVEPKINNAYPDIVFAEYNPILFEQWNRYRNHLDLSDLKILSIIYDYSSITSEEIVKKLSVKYKGLLLSIEKLYDAQLIDRADGKWGIVNGSFFGLKKIECVEAKISKWNEVFQQALLNKTFSSESSVLSKLKGDPRDSICTTFNEFGIGIYVYKDYAFSRLSKPKKKNIPMNYNSLIINEWIGRILNS